MLGGLVGAADVAAGGVLLAGAGACVRLVGATWKVLNGAKAGGGNGEAEHRGRVDQILDTVVKVQDHSIAELAEVRRSGERTASCAERTAETLERVVALLDAHDRRTAEAMPAMRQAAEELHALYREKFPR